MLIQDFLQFGEKSYFFPPNFDEMLSNPGRLI